MKLFGESAIGLTNEKELINALNKYAKGYILLLENFSNNEEQQALVIRYGNAVKYVSELLEFGEATSFGGEKNIIPEPGYFYRTNEELLARGFYFEERKFMVAFILQSVYETIDDIENAKFWAYKSIELSQQLEEGKYIPILQNNIHYLIQDRQYRQAYNLMAVIENFYSRLKQKVEAEEELDETLQKMVQHIKQNDLAIYFFILLPITFSFSLDIVQGNVTPEQYTMMISDAFNSDRYPIKDNASFEFAKKLFEEIMINRISFQQLLKTLEAHIGEMKEMFYIIGYILLSSFTNAKEAINLQLAIIVRLDKTMEGMKALYRFSVIPYFEKFWKQKLANHSADFIGKEHLRLKGFNLIENATWEKKIKTVFRVFSDHLSVDLTDDARDYVSID